MAHHAVISYTYWSTRDQWHFDGPQGKLGVKTQPCMQIYAVYPTRKQVSPKVRALIAFLAQAFRKPRWPA